MLRVAVFAALICVAFGDTIANCTYEDAAGLWNFEETAKVGDSSIQCTTQSFTNNSVVVLKLEYPNVAVDENGNLGTWTIIYNQGFEVNINFRKYFVYFAYTDKTYDCSKTMPGWSHDITVRNWACIRAAKQVPMKPRKAILTRTNKLQLSKFRNDPVYIERINSHQNSWTAKAYPHFESLTSHSMHRMRGGYKSRIPSRPRPAPSTPEVQLRAAALPDAFDWRNVNGENFVSPVRNQGQCGSCYSFSSMGMLEARVRVASKNKLTPVFSPQDIVSCSKYSQGCEGGFPYLIGGKYAQDYGVVSEECNPYNGQDTTSCGTNSKCSRTYTAAYGYVGGYYGACNEDLMKLALVSHGPLSVSFEVYEDFQQYKGGVYHHTGLTSGFNPFEITNHAVLAVGYGVDNSTGEKYWIVKNSWGDSWGEKGYFRIRRGTDECAIESIAVEAFPIL